MANYQSATYQQLTSSSWSGGIIGGFGNGSAGSLYINGTGAIQTYEEQWRLAMSTQLTDWEYNFNTFTYKRRSDGAEIADRDVRQSPSDVVSDEKLSMLYADLQIKKARHREAAKAVEQTTPGFSMGGSIGTATVIDHGTLNYDDMLRAVRKLNGI